MLQLMGAIAFIGIVLFSIGITMCYVETRKDLKELEESVIRDRQRSMRVATLLAKGVELVNADIENMVNNNLRNRNVRHLTSIDADAKFLAAIKNEFDWGNGNE